MIWTIARKAISAVFLLLGLIILSYLVENSPVSSGKFELTAWQKSTGKDMRDEMYTILSNHDDKNEGIGSQFSFITRLINVLSLLTVRDLTLPFVMVQDRKVTLSQRLSIPMLF